MLASLESVLMVWGKLILGWADPSHIGYSLRSFDSHCGLCLAVMCSSYWRLQQFSNCPPGPSSLPGLQVTWQSCQSDLLSCVIATPSATIFLMTSRFFIKQIQLHSHHSQQPSLFTVLTLPLFTSIFTLSPHLFSIVQQTVVIVTIMILVKLVSFFFIIIIIDIIIIFIIIVINSSSFM